MVMAKQFSKMIGMLMQSINIPDDAPANNVAVFVKDILTDALSGVDDDMSDVVDTLVQIFVLNANENPQAALDRLVKANEKFVQFYNSQ